MKCSIVQLYYMKENTLFSEIISANIFKFCSILSILRLLQVVVLKWHPQEEHLVRLSEEEVFCYWFLIFSFA